ncbi:MAG TPA: DUF6209 family protein, partial [Polyangia bacterium]|nr:DUF6209 family protein [Polyangia bacterium]
MKRSVTTVLTCAALAACTQPIGTASRRAASTRAADVATPADAPSSPPATLSFNADWTVQQSGSLTAGGEAIVHYDLARLPTCRATDLQVPAWNVIANWRVDNGLAVSQSVTTDTSSTTRVGTDITIAVQPGHALDLWFYDSDDTACQTWDSNYG